MKSCSGLAANASSSTCRSRHIPGTVRREAGVLKGTERGQIGAGRTRRSGAGSRGTCFIQRTAVGSRLRSLSGPITGSSAILALRHRVRIDRGKWSHMSRSTRESLTKACKSSSLDRCQAAHGASLSIEYSVNIELSRRCAGLTAAA
jgi:hypothetical protein